MLSGRAIVNLQKLVGSVAVSEYIVKYVARLVRATRPKDASAPEFVQELVDWGPGPRAGQFLIHGGKALAAMDGRFSVAIDDVKKVAVPVLRHRISTNFQAQAEGMTSEGSCSGCSKKFPSRRFRSLKNVELLTAVPRKRSVTCLAGAVRRATENSAHKFASRFSPVAAPDDFPERGRIDYIAGQIEVDMSPEDLFTHGSLKTEIAVAYSRARKA